MKSRYSEKDIERFYKRFRELPVSYPIEKVHQLINNPNALARHKVKFQFNQLKFLIMTSIIIIGVAALLLWPTSENYIKDQPGSRNEVISTEKDNQPFNPRTNDIPGRNSTLLSELQSESKQFSDKNKTDGFIGKENPSGMQPDKETNQLYSSGTDCNWPSDTVVDKRSLYVYLSNAELERLGIHIVDPSGSKFYYFGVEGSKSSSQCFNVPCRSDTMKPSPFYIAALTDTLCTTEMWGSDFYEEADTLLPVLATDFTYKNRIFWFIPSDSIFRVLPYRYQYLKKKFGNLKCVKRNNPDRQIVNHWDINRNTILDEINYLELSKAELEAIGIRFYENGFDMTDPTGTFYYRLDYNGTESGNRKRNINIEFPNMFPALITDIKGLEQNRYGLKLTNYLERNNRSNFDLLVPVLMPANNYIYNRNYELIFWYYPTEDFINALPERIRNQLRSEMIGIKEGITSIDASCTYFEACKSTLQLDDLMIYPNPAAQQVNIEFSLPASTNGRISLVSISGIEVKTLVPEGFMPSGYNHFTASLSGITPGVYLISIITKEGFKTQRIVITH